MNVSGRLAKTAAAFAIGAPLVWLALPDAPRRTASLRKSERHKVVILGTGWAALEVVRKADLNPDLDVTIVSPRPFFLYTPLLAGATVGTVHHGNIIEPIRRFIQGSETSTYVHASVRLPY